MRPHDRLRLRHGRPPQHRVLPGAVVTQYAYDGAGRLSETWDPRITPALKTTYGYDGAGRVTTLTPSGELPWTFGYDADGRLKSVTRPTLKPGTADQIAGEAKTTIVYGCRSARRPAARPT
ncbi:RHS repeat protein [Nonomuraea sp. NEAU-L178]|nr:RHS repeat protein [Nonomuraea aurantiaca]